MILVDYNQVTIATLMMQLKHFKGPVVNGDGFGLNKDSIRHMVLNSLQSYRKKFHSKYGELVLCADDTNNWRKDHFPLYKANRKLARQDSDLDWNEIFSILNDLREEFKENLPYKVLRVSRAEADDIIGTLCHEFGSYGICSESAERILIVSSDKDYMQLQKYANVEQYDPVKKKLTNIDNPARFIKEHIIRGDSGDGVPNFLSDDDTFMVEGKRQKPIQAKKLDQWNTMEPEEFCDENMLRGYRRNEVLINLDFIPEEMQAEIIAQFNETVPQDRSRLFSYFIEKRLKNHMENIQSF